ncbi:hypothetical protein GCM10023321_18700 [Pseudonocardia eucalypti]|uniref:Restriction endonuclease n=1 Tax=Pseudonocardia eucalypti TaxID=648755 RepID=A0ABP9PWT7_9PSEU|nr:hypothetical protein [Pseudonocardia eucalypti]
MAHTPEDTVEEIVAASSWDRRVAGLRLVPQRHGTVEHSRIFAEVARAVYVPALAPDFAYIHPAPFYEPDYFQLVYDAAHAATEGFASVGEDELAAVLTMDPRTLLVFRTIAGLTKEEFGHASALVGGPLGLPPVSASKVDSMERRGIPASAGQVQVVARTLTRIMDGTLFGEPAGELRSKQDKPDTADGWASVRKFADGGVPFALFLHQRHYGGSFRQLLDATSSRRGNLIEDAVEALFAEHGISFIRTGAHNQGEIADRFEVQVTPAPDFVVYDGAGALRAMLECKATNNGGTARDKALRFERLRDESVRLGGVPLIAVLGGMGWARVNDTLGPVVRDTDGRVFTLATLDEMLTVAPFPALIGP